MVAHLRKFVSTRRWVRWGLVALMLLCVAGLVAPYLAAPYLRGKLQAMIASRVDAQLQMGSVAYLPPFGVRVRDAKLVARDASGAEVRLLTFARLDLHLAKLPFGEGPLVIESIDLQDPQTHLVITEQGLLGAASFPATQPAPAASPALPPGTKLSDMFQLRHLAVWGGRVVLEDRTRPGSVPMVWSDLSATTETTPTSPSAYEFELQADHKNVAAMTAAGSFDLDALHLRLRDSNLSVAVDAGQPASGVPAQVQSILREYHVAGKVDIHGSADLPLRDLSAGTFDAVVEIGKASARFPQTDTPLDGLQLRVHSSKAAPTGAIAVRVEQLEATSGGSRLALEKGMRPSLVIDRAANRWTLAEVAGAFDFADAAEGATPFALAGRMAFAAKGSGPLAAPAGQAALTAADYQATLEPRNLRVRPPKFPLPIEAIGGDGGAHVELRPGVVAFKDVSARYGQDQVLLRGARIPIPDDPRDLKRSVGVEEIDGRIDFRRPNAPYPGKFDNVIANLRPAGPFEVGGGSFVRIQTVPPADDGTPPAKRRRADWFFGVSTDAGSFSVTDRQLTLTDISGDATVSNMLVDVTRFECKTLGGTAALGGKVVPKKPFPVENGRVALREIDLAQLARAFQPQRPSDKLVGRGFLNMTFAGSASPDAPPAEALRGQGEFEAIEGHFWTLPALGHIASRAAKDKPMAMGDAAGTFRIENRSVLLERAALSSPALGLIGSGTVGFDKTLDLRIVAAPLGDWRDHVKRTRIPVVSDVAGEVVGGVQRLLGAATSTLLYQFRVTGRMGEPKVETIPAPVLTDPAALLFGHMLEEHRKRKLLESVKNTPPM